MLTWQTDYTWCGLGGLVATDPEWKSGFFEKGKTGKTDETSKICDSFADLSGPAAHKKNYIVKTILIPADYRLFRAGRGRGYRRIMFYLHNSVEHNVARNILNVQPPCADACV